MLAQGREVGYPSSSDKSLKANTTALVLEGRDKAELQIPGVGKKLGGNRGFPIRMWK